MKIRVIVPALIVVFALFAAAALASDYSIPLKSRTFTPKVSAYVEKELKAFRGRHALVQLKKTPDARERKEFEAEGIRLLKSLPGHAWLAFIENSAGADKSATDKIRYVGEFSAVDKVHPMVMKGNYLPHSEAAEGRRVLNIAMYPDVSEDAGRNVLRSRGAVILSYTKIINTYLVELAPAAVRPLAKEDAVLTIAEATPAFSPNLNITKPAVGGDIANDAPYSTTGQGVTVFVLDGGTVTPNSHVDLGDRVQVSGMPMPDISGHAHNVSCIIAGDGTKSQGLYEGMAPDASIVSSVALAYRMPPLYNDPSAIDGPYQKAVQNLGATVSNNSIGANLAKFGTRYCEYEGDYEGTAQLIDSIIAEQYGRIHIVWSVGNERGYEACGTEYGTVPPPANAKNSITVGAVNKEDLSMTYFSSWGPSDDGRLRPDISAPGCALSGTMLSQGIMSCNLFDTYLAMCGTSQAGPVVTGGVALAQQYWRDHRNAEDAWASTMKALLIHSAWDHNTDGPNYRDGYGILYVPDLLDLIDSAIIVEDRLDEGETYTLTLTPAGSRVKVTLVWTDPAALPNTSHSLVNDLDLSVETAWGTELPWVLDPAQPEKSAEKGVNTIDPVEQVLFTVQDPSDLMDVVVTGSDVPEGPQKFSLIVTGLTEPGQTDDDDTTNDEDDGAGDDDDDQYAGGCGC